MSTQDKIKITSVQFGATANSSDAELRDRSTHTGTQSISTITGLSSELNDKISVTEKGVPDGVATLDSNGKVPLSQINDSLIGQVEFIGLWDANTNTPLLDIIPEQKGHYYIVSVAGTQFGIDFEVGDWLISIGTNWDKVDNTDAVSTVNGQTGVVVLDKTSIGLSNVDNTSDLDKPVSTATQSALDLKVDKVAGKQLSTEDYTTAEKDKLSGIAIGAEVNQNAYSFINVAGQSPLSADITTATLNVQAGSNVSITTNPATNTLTINSLGSGGSLTYDAGFGLLLSGTTFSLLDERYTTAEKTKLSGIEPGAQENQFAISFIEVPGQDTISSSTYQDAVTLSPGSNVSITTDSLTNTIVIDSLDTTYSAGTGITLTGTTFSLTDESFTLAEKNKLAGIDPGAQVNTVDSVNGQTGVVVLDKTSIGLSNVDNTSDLDKPVSTATQLALDTKVDKVVGKQLSTEDYTTAEKNKLAGISPGAEVNQNAFSTVAVSGQSSVVADAIEDTLTLVAGSNVTITTNATTDTITISATNTNTTYSAGTGITLTGTTFSLSGESYTSAEKTKLAGIETGAQVNVGTNLGVTNGTTAGPTITSSTGSNVVFPTASATISGAVTTGAQTFAGTKTFSNTISGSITGNAGTVTNGVYTTGSYSNPSWITSLDAAKLTGTIADARLSGTYSGFTHKIDGSNTVFTTPSSGTASTTARTVYGLAEFRGGVSSVSGAIVFKAPNNTIAIMMQIEIAVMLYSTAQISHITVQGYRSTETNFASLLKLSKGTTDIQVRFASEVSTSKTCIILGDATSSWSYPHVSIIRAMFSHGNTTDAYCTGWTTALETSLSGYENITGDIPDSPMVGSVTGSAATLTTARTINGTSFNGSANITTANWGTARTLTIGSTGKSVNGSGNVSWSLAEIGAADASNTVNLDGNQTIGGNKTFTGDTQLSNGGVPLNTIFRFNFNNAGLGWGVQETSANGHLVFQTRSDTGAWTTRVNFGTAGDITATSFTGSGSGLTSLNASNLTSGTVPDARISGSYTGLTNLTGSGNVDFAKFLGNASDTAAAPSYSWTGDTNTGIWQPGADQIGFTTGGTNRLSISTTAITSTLNITAPTFSGSLTGNASTATSAATLTTARTINGTNFNGSANITTANWGTARNITIGNTAKSVNGSGNVSWSLAEIGAQAALGFTPVQQGGGTLQGTNKIYLGWGSDGSQLRLQVDSTDFGNSFPINITKNAATATTLQTARTINRTSFNGSANIEVTEWFHSFRDFPNGTLVTTDINYAVSSGDPWVLEVKGNSYGPGPSFDLQAHGYIYDNTIINASGLVNGFNMTGIVAMNIGGNLCFWWPRYGYWQGFNVRVYSAYEGQATNRVTSITNLADPGGTKRVTISDKLKQSLREDNFNSYAPTLTGTGASGTWGISVTGNAGSATTLQTTRTINGTSFNGSANITTANWGTARTLTIGSTGKSVNGSGNVSWSLAEIGALPLTGGTLTGNLVITSFETNNPGTGSIIAGWNSNRFRFRFGGTNTPIGLSISNYDTTTIELNRDGSINAAGNITAYFSDDRLKTKIEKIGNAINKVKSLEGFIYTENTLAEKFGYNNKNRQAGISAQSVQKVLPEAVTLAPFDTELSNGSNIKKSISGENYLTVDYSKLVPLLIEAIKEQQQQIDELKKIIGNQNATT